MGQRCKGGKTFAVFFIDQDIGRQWQVTCEPHADQAMLAQGAEQAIEGHGRDVADGCAPLQTEATMGGDQGLTRDDAA